MIDAFTRLKDYESATEQQLEIINRERKNEEINRKRDSIRPALRQRRKAFELLLKLSAEAFKNYRWNVVLARIYGQAATRKNAAKNYGRQSSTSPK